VAATLTADQELVYASFPISKTEELPDGNLLVYGKATDGTVDSDRQVVDVSWSAQALKQWLDTGGNVRVQHQPQRDPAGKGLQIDVTPDGHWVKSLIVEPVAQRLVRAKVLTAYSVGISRPRIDPDPTGKAMGGIIRGNADTQIVEVSLVDRPANKNCGFQLVAKSAGGELDWVGKVWGEELLTKDGGGTATPATADDDPEDVPDYDMKPDPGTEPTEPTDDSETGKGQGQGQGQGLNYITVSVELPSDVSVAFSPADLAKLQTYAQKLGEEDAAFKVVGDAEEAFLGKAHRKFGARRRRQLAGSGNALADGSYPIPDADALRRASVLARSGHGNVAAARRLIARRAKELKVPNPLSENDAVKEEETVEDVSKSMTCGTCKGPLTDGKCMKCMGKAAAAVEVDDAAEKGIAQMNHDDNDTDSDADEDEGTDKAAKPKKGGKGKGKGGGGKPPWLNSDKDNDDDDEGSDDSNKASMPNPADGVTGMTANAVPIHREPDGLAIESFEHDAGMPTVPDSSVKSDADADAVPFTEMDAALRLKSIGVAHQLGVLHDLCCPVFAPGDVAKAHPDSNFDSIDLMFFAQKAMDSAAGGSMEEAMRATALWTHAQTLKMVGVSGMLALQEEAHKAFRDANPGVSSFPTPGHISAERYRRGDITAGHAAASPGAEGPHTAVIPSAGGITAEQYGRGFISDGHAADSPANKGAGVPSSVDYVPTIQENARAAMRAMHDHVSQTFPDVCCIGPGDGAGMRNPVPVPAGVPAVSAAPIGQSHKSEAEPATATATAEPDVFKGAVAPDIEKARKKMRKKLGKKVLAGKMTVDEARAKIGRNVAQKTGGQTMIVSPMGGGMKAEEQPEAVKSARPEPREFPPGYTIGGLPAAPGVDADVFKSLLAEAVGPLLERLAANEAVIREQSDMIHKMADMPDPGVAAFRGMAYKSLNSAGRPGGVQTVAEIAERSQAAMLREMEVTWRTSADPREREAAWRSINKMRGFES